MDTKATTTERVNRTRQRKNAKAKAAPRKAAASAKRSAGKASAKRSSSNGYGQAAANLMTRGKAALGSAYSWAGDASHRLPRAARKLHMPEHGALQDYVSDRPLIIGAVGLGLGMAIGAMLPNATTMRRAVSTRKRRK